MNGNITQFLGLIKTCQQVLLDHFLFPFHIILLPHCESVQVYEFMNQSLLSLCASIQFNISYCMVPLNLQNAIFLSGNIIVYYSRYMFIKVFMLMKAISWQLFCIKVQPE